jgi:adenylate cyclase
VSDTLTASQLSERTGATAADLETWRAEGLLGTATADRFPPDATDRVRLIQRLLRRGIPLAEVSTWAATGEMDRHLALIAPASGGAHTVAEAAALTGVSERLVELFVDAVDLEGRGAHLLTDEDVEALRCLKPAGDAGLPEHAIIDLARVFWDAMQRVAETEAHLFHFHVRRAFTDRGLAGRDLDDAVWGANAQLEPLDEPALLYFHRRALRHAIADMTALEVAERAGLSVPDAEHGIDVAVAFVDLASYTPMTEAMGDEEAAGVLGRFAAIVREAVRAHDGHVVKQIGDAFMIVFPDARHAVPAVLDVERRSDAEPSFPAIRVGVNAGPVVFQAGEYVGTTVNVAARLADAAGRHQVLVTASVRQAAGDLPGIAFRPAGTQRLKGLAEPLEVWEARATDAHRGPRLTDPVCGMEMAPEEVAVRLSSETGDLAFCSQTCLRRWVARADQSSP